MTSNELTCTVYGDRAKLFEQVFGTDTVPIVSPIAEIAKLPGMDEARVYKLNLDKITAEQRARLVAHLSGTFGLSESEVEKDLDTVGMPILADHSLITIPPALALSMMDDLPDVMTYGLEWDDETGGE